MCTVFLSTVPCWATLFVLPVAMLSKVAAALVLAAIVGFFVWLAREALAVLIGFVFAVVGLAAVMLWALRTLGV